MRRHPAFIAIVLAVVTLAHPATSGAAVTCPVAPSGWWTFEILAEPGDPAPGRGEDPPLGSRRGSRGGRGPTLQDLAGAFGLDDVDGSTGSS